MTSFDGLLPPPPPELDGYRFGTVTASAPARVQLDGDTAPLPITPTVLGTVAVGDKVWVQLHGRQLIILGVVNPAQM